MARTCPRPGRVPNFNVLSDDDAKALVAYLRTIAPIENAVAGNTDLKLPKMDVPPAKGTPPKDDPVAQGEYLATLMHCAGCHTPFDEKSGPDMSKAFSGGMKIESPMLGEGAVYSSNITPHEATGIGKWTDAEVITAVRQMKKRDGSPILPPMSMYASGWGKMTDADVANLVKYLRSLPPIENAVPASTLKPKGPPPGGSPP